MNLNLSGNVVNSGSIAGRNTLKITAENIQNLGGQMSGNDVKLAARQDFDNLAGMIKGVDSAAVSAGRDLNLTTTTQSSENQAGGNRFTQTGIDRVAGIYVSGPAGVLVASAGNNLNLTAAQIQNAGAGAAVLTAGNKLNLNTVAVGSSQDINWDSKNYLRQSSTLDVGTQITGAGRVNLSAGQDINARAASRNQSAGGSLTISPVGVPIGGGLNAGRSKVNSNYQSVSEQSGIQAGDGGFQVSVKGDTDLKGGVIASNQTAIDQDKNRFNTAGALTTSDLHNSAHYDGQAVGVNASVGNDAGKFGVKGVGAGVGQDSGSAQGTTTAGISGIAGDQSVRTGDATGIERIFDQNKVQREIDAQVAITAEFGKQASKAVGDYAGRKYNELKDLDPVEAAKWSEGGAYRVAMHAVVGGLSGGVQGAAGAALSQASIDAIGAQIAKSDLPLALKEALAVAAGTALGASVGGFAGAASGLNATVNNYLTVADLKKNKGSKEELQNQSLVNNYKVEAPCVAQDSKACGEAIAKALSDIGELRGYKEQLIIDRDSQTNPDIRTNLTAQIDIVDRQIKSANNSIRFGGMALNGGSFTFGDMSDQELMALGFAFDAIGAAELRSIVKANNSIAALGEKLSAFVKNRILEADAGSVKLVNPTNSQQNCTNCVVVVDNLLTTGNPASALPRDTPLPFSQLGEAFGTKFSGWVSQQNIEKTMLSRGEGARAVIYGTDGATGHVWNAVVQNGKINYIDGQIGGNGAVNFKTFNNFQFGILP
ncbi:toxin glutamine deamidase domain-containing protein [Comamonas testosteroni]|uniref:toxin glutamine deamidase domain-containing protein n=1 Tax=Comamonas testosteroni TaxID=285 RepID=UPI00128EA4C8|nr:toxin glutamine deamidase domain-containing protein [Comamonas testosteroni]